MCCPPEPYSHSNNKTKVDLSLSNYATKSDLKGVTSIKPSKSAKKTHFFNLKSDVDRLDVGKPETTPTEKSNVRNVVKKHVIYKTVYDGLVKNILIILIQQRMFLKKD